MTVSKFPISMICVLPLLIVGSQVFADDCDDYTTLAGYAVIGEDEFEVGNNSTMNGNSISGSGNTPTPTGNMTTVDLDFPALSPSIFPSTGGADITTKSDYTLNAGSYGEVKLDKTNRTITMPDAADYYIEQLILAKNGDVAIFSPGNYFIEKLDMAQSTSIVLSGTGQVKLYIKESFQADNQVSLNGGGEVGNFMIFLYSDAEFEVGNANQGNSGLDFSGIIYSPYANTEIEFGNNVDIEGAILSAGEVEVGNNTDFTYDSDTENSVLEAFGCSGGGDPDPVVASGFNCIHSAAVDSSGRLYTRIVDSAFTVDVAALKVDETLEADYASDQDRDITVQLVESDCSTPASAAQTLTFEDADDGRKTSAAITVSSAYANVKCLVTDVSESASYCSSDSFSIRPASLTLSTPTLNNAGFSGTPKAIAGSNFTLEVTTVPGYNGTPVIAGSVDAHSGGTAGTLTGAFSAANINTGTATGTAFAYSEVGNFRFQANAIRDTGFTVIDQTSDCVDNSYSNTIDVNGKVGCDFSNVSATDWVGRFIPDHFDISNTNGMLVNNCGSAFSYTGRDIGFATDPMITITAKNSSNLPTVNYTGSYAHLTSSGSYAVSTASPAVFPVTGSQFTVAGTDNSTAGAVSSNVSLLWDDSSAQDDSSDSFMAASGSNGVFTTYFSGLKINFDKVANNIVAPFTPDVTLAATLQVNDGDGVVSSAALSVTPQDNTVNPVLVRYGRLNIMNAYGSELQTLPMVMQVEYYNGAANGFVPNTDDSCTAINNVVITDTVADTLSVNETCIWDSAGNSGSYNCATAGDLADQYSPNPIGSNFNLNLKGPGAGNTGVLNVTADAPSYLEYDWTGGGLGDPTGTASFGIHNRDSQTIFLKEVR
jgi:hypothetical protein